MIVPNQATKLFIEQHILDDVHQLALKSAPQEVNLSLAVQLIGARQSLKKKVPLWANNPQLLFPKHLSLEQASSQSTAEYKAQWIQQNIKTTQTLIDLTGGLGIDCFFMGQHFQTVHYCEQQKELCTLAQHNYAALNQHQITVHSGQSHELIDFLPQADVLFIDPARRDQTGKKTVTFEDCTPNVVAWKEDLLNKAKTVIIKASPMLDITLAIQQLQTVKEVHIISVGGECKELLFILQKEFNQDCTLHCINILKDKTQILPSFTLQQEKELIGKYSKECKQYLYEPNASILKAGAYKIIEKNWNIEALHVSSHLYTSDSYFEDFPGRIFEVKKHFPFQKKEIKKQLQHIEKCNITTRNFPISVANLRQKLKLKEGGDWYLFATTLYSNDKYLILCQKYPH